MTQVTTSVTMVPITNPVIGLPGGNTYTPIPRAIITYTNTGIGTAVPVATAGDTQLVLIEAALAPSFGYVLRDVTLRVVGVDFVEWVANAHMGYKDKSDGLKNSVSMGLALQGFPCDDLVITEESMVYVPTAPLPQRVMIAHGSNAKVFIRVANNVADGSAMVVRCVIELYQYDLDQSYNFSVHTPALVR